MNYNPTEYWEATGRDRENTEHESNFVRTEVFARQEERLLALLEGLEFRSVLEVGCGWGRITELVHERWPDAEYTAIDLSRDRLMSAQRKAPGVTFVRSTVQGYGPARRYDLVLAVEILMHVVPSEIEAVIARLLSFSSRHVVSLDWAVPISGEVSPWNFCHPYGELYGSHLVSVHPAGPLQAIFLADVQQENPRTPLSSENPIP